MPPTRMQEDRTPSSRRSSESMSEMCDSCHVTILVITASKGMQVHMYMHNDLCQIILTALSDGAFASAAAPGGAVGIAAVACSAGTIVVVCSGF